MTDWHDISTAPRDGTVICIRNEASQECEGYWYRCWYRRNRFWFDTKFDSWMIYDRPTHWRPINTGAETCSKSC